ncbi:MAG: DUF1189 family protein [Clostridium sp.]|uniref:DUF1189 family protein n=1 Tax=Clostridium sp. TaxID=1506 RepID=UPI0025C48747|nr:DUF1189 family protein [Clostridium sp.]MCF0147087.1 DUF1189 family protein [Clostridium sp.]
MNEKISFIKKLKISITSIKGYNDLIKEKLSKAIIYSLLFSLIIGVIQGIISFVTISSIQNTMENVISSDEFKFTLQDGILNFENSPIKTEEGRNIVYIDTNISLDEKESIRSIVVHKDSSIAILRDGISVRLNGEETNFKFNEVPLVGQINNEMLLKSLNIIGIAKYIAFFSSIILTYIIFMLNSLILSVIGLILNGINKLGLKYENILKISIYATTAPTILGLIFPLGTYGILISGMYFILVANYLRIKS